MFSNDFEDRLVIQGYPRGKMPLQEEAEISGGTGTFKMKRKFQKEPFDRCVERVLLAARTAPSKTPKTYLEDWMDIPSEVHMPWR